MKPSVFIVSYYWPPAGGPGVQRWLKFIKYLPKDDFNITLIVPENPDYASTDKSLMEEIPEGITTIKVPIKEPSRFLKNLFGKKTKKLQRGFIDKKPGLLERSLLWIRGNYFIPDARVSWVTAIVQTLESNIAFAKANYLITTGPPHSVHLVGLNLKADSKYSNLNWIADFRDPWTTIGYHKSLRLTKTAAQKHFNLEKKVLQTAGEIIVTSPSTKTEFQTKTKRPITVITNGFDLNPNHMDQPTGKFKVSHIGTLLADRNPLGLWDALSTLCREIDGFADDLQLELAGNVSENIVESIKDAGLEKQLNLLGYVQHDRAVELMNLSQVLLLIEINSAETNAIIPGKTFEYIASRRPIIAIGPAQSDIQGLMEESGSGSYHTYQDESLKPMILKLYNQYKSGSLTGNVSDISRYHRKTLTHQLIQVLQS